MSYTNNTYGAASEPQLTTQDDSTRSKEALYTKPLQRNQRYDNDTVVVDNDLYGGQEGDAEIEAQRGDNVYDNATVVKNGYDLEGSSVVENDLYGK